MKCLIKFAVQERKQSDFFFFTFCWFACHFLSNPALVDPNSQLDLSLFKLLKRLLPLGGRESGGELSRPDPPVELHQQMKSEEGNKSAQ